MAAAGQVVKTQGKIVLATVKGDVHDIGKNIVGVVLACNNYEVIDMGVMVPCEKILERAKPEKADLIGLSGLITPSLDEMAHVAREMERQGFKLPLLIGGATTSRAHTAVKIAPHYSEPVVHVLDASRAVPVTTSLLSDEGKPAFVAQHRAEYEELRQHPRRAEAQARCRSRRRARTARRSSGAPRTSPAPDVHRRARARRLPARDAARVHRLDAVLPHLGAQGRLSAHPRAREVRRAGAHRSSPRRTRCSTTIIAKKLLTARGVYGLFPANAVGDDVELYTDETRSAVLERFHFLRQQTQRRRRRAVPLAWPTSSRPRRPGFAITSAASPSRPASASRSSATASGREHDDYNAIMAEALADRLAEAFAECLHKRVRDEWGYGRGEDLTHGRAHRTRSTAASARPPATPRAPITPRRARSGSCSTSRRTPACSSPSRSRCGRARA